MRRVAEMQGQTEEQYNYFRDYDPALGRYLESDPLGLEGGINTFSYVESDPLSYTDEFGLFRRLPPMRPDPRKPKPNPPKPASPGKCSTARHRVLQGWVDFWCKAPWVSEQCLSIRWCIDARRNLNNECYGGGDTGHRDAIGQKQREYVNKKCPGTPGAAPTGFVPSDGPGGVFPGC